MQGAIFSRPTRMVEVQILQEQKPVMLQSILNTGYPFQVSQ